MTPPSGGPRQPTPPSAVATVAAAGSADAPRDSKGRPRHPWFRENLEAITVAIIMALVIRQFCVEAFKIPTGSMAPTLLGGDAGLFSSDDPRTGRPEPVGDRILVNKFIYLLREPARWDVIVFKYPLNNTRNFIKRLVGLPGETLEIKDGDLHVNGAIERKPRWLQEALWKNWPIWRQGASGPFLKRFTPEPGAEARWSEDEEEDRVKVSGGEPSFIAFRGALVDSTTGGGLRNSFIGDIRLALEVEPGEGPAGEFVCEIREGATRYEFFVPVEGQDGSKARISIDGTVVAEAVDGAASLPRGDKTEVAFENVDDTLVLLVDGDALLTHRYDAAPGTPDRRSGLRFGTTGAAFTLSEIGVYRDIYYTNAGVLAHGKKVEIPNDSLFALGDNSPESKDSRLWESRTYELADGRMIKGDPGEPETFRRVGSRILMADVFGETYAFDESSIARQHPDEYAPFIPRRNVMGKAFFVFWPVTHRASTYARFWGGPTVKEKESWGGLVFNPKFIR